MRRVGPRESLGHLGSGTSKSLPGSDRVVGTGLWERGGLMISQRAEVWGVDAPGCSWSAPARLKEKPRAGSELTRLQPQTPNKDGTRMPDPGMAG